MGKVYLVGAGPGDPDLITLKGLKCIQQADIILYDRLINDELLNYAKPEADLIYCGKLPNYHTMKQETINHFLIKHAKRGKIVTRLKGGDPFVFGRGGEEAQALVKHRIEFEIVPGITSGIAVPAYAGIPVTHRDFSSSVAFITGHQRTNPTETLKWEHLAKGVDTLVIYMGVKQLPFICEQLQLHGKHPKTPIAIIQWGTLYEQKTVVATLDTILDAIEKQPITNPSIIVVGEVVTLHEQLHWFETMLREEKYVNVMR
ncbi:uroporphyrinogen-III C-methyltransferase [Thermolongibacillus altinsuensis]|jgi:uroporphyrin-III C-methyltransferase|uniref:uroporphyrinogen-III C-methyltransferase n=1 Tax=Thermolongibacillus altinsuensis TaxID=575256 RepID=UPI00242A301C|nr:uroporphyrinogen-III C-methyltransferase [Thermolongibacillus altinsuensis]GMB09261.1 uroporphyrin-III C-methyltransferase [Thermolongibacillus altinsuensis]